jgi:hypothetical protein
VPRTRFAGPLTGAPDCRQRCEDVSKKGSPMRLSPLIFAAAVIAGTVTLDATTYSFYDKGYNFSTLKTFDFKSQRRISRDPIADNRIWGDVLKLFYKDIKLKQRT